MRSSTWARMSKPKLILIRHGNAHARSTGRGSIDEKQKGKALYLFVAPTLSWLNSIWIWNEDKLVVRLNAIKRSCSVTYRLFLLVLAMHYFPLIADPDTLPTFLKNHEAFGIVFSQRLSRYLSNSLVTIAQARVFLVMFNQEITNSRRQPRHGRCPKNSHRRVEHQLLAKKQVVYPVYLCEKTILLIDTSRTTINRPFHIGPITISTILINFAAPSSSNVRAHPSSREQRAAHAPRQKGRP